MLETNDLHMGLRRVGVNLLKRSLAKMGLTRSSGNSLCSGGIQSTYGILDVNLDGKVRVRPVLEREVENGALAVVPMDFVGSCWQRPRESRERAAGGWLRMKTFQGCQI